MRRDLFAKLALGSAGIFIGGSLAGMGLANYTASGAFEFYRQQPISDWEPTLPAQPAALQSTDLAFASDHRGGAAQAGAKEVFASLDP